jgi:sec-independent protein translocase protein TatC
MDEKEGGDSSQHPDIYPDDPYGSAPKKDKVSDDSPLEKMLARFSQPGGGKKLPPPSGGGDGGDGEDEEEEGMLRMSFLDHLGELRSRIIRALVGFGLVFLVCLVFSNQLWLIVQAPAVEAFKRLTQQAQVADEEKVTEVCKPPATEATSAPCADAVKAAKTPKVGGSLVGIDPMEQFSILWMWTPLVASIFLGSPWILYQIWAFIAPGLYKSERRWAVPFVLTTAGLFISGGLFAYFVAFRFGLTFLLGLGGFAGIKPMISIDKYFELFVDVMLGVSAIFEMPVIIFFMVLLRLATPKFLMEHSRYAILAIVILAAIITPTPDVFNLMLFAVPMCMLFFVGVFAGYLLVLHREKRKFPWAKVMPWLLVILVILALTTWVLVTKYHYHLVKHWPFLMK